MCDVMCDAGRRDVARGVVWGMTTSQSSQLMRSRECVVWRDAASGVCPRSAQRCNVKLNENGA